MIADTARVGDFANLLIVLVHRTQKNRHSDGDWEGCPDALCVEAREVLGYGDRDEIGYSLQEHKDYWAKHGLNEPEHIDGTKP